MRDSYTGQVNKHSRHELHQVIHEVALAQQQVLTERTQVQLDVVAVQQHLQQVLRCRRISLFDRFPIQ